MMIEGTDVGYPAVFNRFEFLNSKVEQSIESDRNFSELKIFNFVDIFSTYANASCRFC